MLSRTILPASLLAAALVLPLASAARANILVSIDKTTQNMSVVVDGAPRYIWPVSTGRPGYDTPNGTFKPNRMDADHFSQEWDNAPMPHTIFFDMKGHAVHGFSDVKHLGLAVSHGCVRLSPANAATLFDLVKTEGMSNTIVVVSGQTPGGGSGPVARAHLPMNETVSSAPMAIAPGYGQQPPPGYAQQPASGFPQQPAPYYGRTGYSQNYSGQTYNRQPYDGQSYDDQGGYQQQQNGWSYRRF